MPISPGGEDLNESNSQLHVITLVYFYEPDLSTPDSLLERYATIRPFAKALENEGARVTVMQRFHTDLEFCADGIRYRFLKDSCTPAVHKWEIHRSFHRAVRAVCSSHGPGSSPSPALPRAVSSHARAARNEASRCRPR